MWYVVYLVGHTPVILSLSERAKRRLPVSEILKPGEGNYRYSPGKKPLKEEPREVKERKGT